MAQINDGNAFTKEVRRAENLPEPGPITARGSGVSARVARSGKTRVPDIPTAVTPSERAAAASRDARPNVRNGGFIDASGRSRAAFGQGADPVRRPPPSLSRTS
jgi:hypothetical protein